METGSADSLNLQVIWLKIAKKSKALPFNSWSRILCPGYLDFYIGEPLVHNGRKKIMGHLQLSFQQDCRSFWQELVTLHHIVLPCLLMTDAFMEIWMWRSIGPANVNHCHLWFGLSILRTFSPFIYQPVIKQWSADLLSSKYMVFPIDICFL